MEQSFRTFSWTRTQDGYLFSKLKVLESRNVVGSIIICIYMFVFTLYRSPFFYLVFLKFDTKIMPVYNRWNQFVGQTNPIFTSVLKRGGGFLKMSVLGPNSFGQNNLPHCYGKTNFQGYSKLVGKFLAPLVVYLKWNMCFDAYKALPYVHFTCWSKFTGFFVIGGEFASSRQRVSVYYFPRSLNVMKELAGLRRLLCCLDGWAQALPWEDELRDHNAMCSGTITDRQDPLRRLESIDWRSETSNSRLLLLIHSSAVN